MGRARKQEYFPREEDTPVPLAAEVKRRVRFEEVDMLGIVWHGRYSSYLEDGRARFGEIYGMGYLDMYHNGFAAPIVQMHIDYVTPLRFPEEFTVRATLHPSEAARMNFSYEIKKLTGELVATAFTVQLLTDLAGDLLLLRPDYVEDFWQRWKRGELE